MNKRRLRRTVLGLFLFAIAFGYVEAAVVIYLRTIIDPLRQQLLTGEPADELFPLMDLGRLRSEAPRVSRLIPMELVREAATMVMLASVAWLAARGRILWPGAFAVVFGIWDLSYYLFLKLLIDWPQSLWNWDLLFLIPVPWTAPVLAPVIVSLSLTGCGLAALQRPIQLQRIHWAGLILATLCILLSFLWQSGNVLAGNVPRQFAWPLFSAGEFAGFAAFMHAFRLSARAK